MVGKSAKFDWRRQSISFRAIGFSLLPGFLLVLTQELAGQPQPVMPLHDAVENGIGNGGDPGMPMLDRQLV